MQTLLGRSIASIADRLVLLAPGHPGSDAPFSNVHTHAQRHRSLLLELQQLRGAVYLRDGAVSTQQLSTDGAHRTPQDARSWHLLMLSKRGDVRACTWYLEHEPCASIDDLRVRSCPLAQTEEWSHRLETAVKSEMDRARRESLRYAEVGGWAVAPACRCTSEGLTLALAAYSLGRLRGGAVGITTATVRHGSSSILRRLGGTSLEAGADMIPSYDDPAYGCRMELLRFDSRHPAAKYRGLVECLEEKLREALVIVPNSTVAAAPVALTA